ncbi:MAG: ABC transporter substrate-binding protein, partial [Chloroflexota bacterium]|nr:ABC transporter substrate-binding protein [Chloroflexota bacterium]
MVVPDVGTPLFTNGKGAYPVNRYHWAFGITETPTTLEPITHKFLPMVADSWELSSDLSKVTLKVHPGIKFNNWNPQWGDAEVTAEDVAYSYNDAGADNPASVHDDAGEYADMYNKWVALDKYTAQGPVDKYRFDILYFSIIQGGSAPSIFSKKVYDTLGPDKALITLVATGPFEAKEWKADDRVVGEAVPNHWRKVPGFKELKVLEIPEASSRVAMLETGQAEIVNVSLKDVSRMTGLGMTAVRNGAYAISTIWPAGNYWQEKNPTTGASIFPRPGFKPDKDHPWIGDPRDPEQMERARKVRWAMSMAIDREAINKAILGGLGVPAYVPTLSSNDGLYQPKWKMDFDPAKAKDLLKEAGYPNGFKFTFFVPPDSGVPPEIGEAVAAMWANIGLATE